MKDFKQTLVDLLKTNIVEVTFTKVNGELRIMPCTLKPDILPPMPIKEQRERKVNDETLSVWCTDKKEWRSFRVSNVTKFEILSK